MESILSLAGIVLLAFAATNLDNLLLLVALLSRPGQRFGAVVRGALLSGAALVALCLAAAFAADLAPTRWIGWLGVVPLALGLRELYRLVASRAGDGSEASTGEAIPALGVAGLMAANSADSLGALLPVFAETETALLPLLVVVLAVAALLGCELARRVASSPSLGPWLERIAPVLVPIALVAVGLYVLSDTRTDTLH